MEPARETPALVVSSVRKTYPRAEKPALAGVSLEAARGTITGLLGTNGAGKTTLISILAGIVKADSGSASILGIDVNNRDAVRRLIGIAPQRIALFGNLTAQENLSYIAAMYGIPAALAQEKSLAVLQALGLERHARKRVAHYSGGMKRRVNIAAALLHEPSFLILDEPTAGVDVQSRALILDFIRKRAVGGLSVLYTSHILEEAEQLCDHIHILDEGKLIVSGSPAELVNTTPDARRLEDVFLHYTGHAIRD